MKPIETFEDLPTDDSVSLESSDDGDDMAMREKRAKNESSSGEEEDSSDDDDSSSDDSSSSSSSGGSSSQSGKDDENENERHVSFEHGAGATEQDGAQEDSGSGDHDSSDDGNSQSSDEEDLQHLPLEERIRRERQETGRRSKAPRVKKEKRSKHAPTEVSSRRADYFQRGAPQLNSSGIGVEIGAHHYKPRDPRQLFASSKKNDDSNNYEFLQELRDKEIRQLKKQIAIRKLPGKKGQKARRKLNLQGSLEDDQEELKRLLQEKASYERAVMDREAKRSVKRQLQQHVASGKKVYYPKRRELKRMQLEARLEEIRKRGGDEAVQKHLQKRQKRQKSRDAGFLQS